MVENLLLLLPSWVSQRSWRVWGEAGRPAWAHMNTGNRPSKGQAVDANCQDGPAEQDFHGLGDWSEGPRSHVTSQYMSSFPKGVSRSEYLFVQKVPRLAAGCPPSHLSGFSVDSKNIHCVVTKHITGGRAGYYGPGAKSSLKPVLLLPMS